MMNLGLIVAILFICTFSGSISALALKKGMNDLPQLNIKSVVTNGWIYLGGALSILSAVANIFLFKFLDFSIATPMLTLINVWTVIMSHFVFREKLTIKKASAVLLIMTGVFIISSGG